MATALRFGIIGCGEVAQGGIDGAASYNGIGGFHADHIAAIEGAELAAVADLSERNAKALADRFDVPHYYLDYKDLLAQPDIDVVNICTPSGTHTEMAVAAARAGKHIILEKPMAVLTDRADTIIAECAHAGVKLRVVFPNRFCKGIRKAKAALDSGGLGRPVVGTALCRRYRTQEYYQESAWRGTWALDGGGALMNQGIHVIDTFLHLMGPVASVSAKMGTLGHEGIEVEDTAVAVVRFESGALGMIQGTTCAYPDFGDHIDVHAEKGSFALDGHPPQLVQWDAIGPESAINVDDYRQEFKTDFYSHRFVIEDMIDAIRTDREPAVNGPEGRRALEVICAIYTSAREEREVEIDAG